jgi:hypothetical protein
MAWFDGIDLYCERVGPGLLAEPLNLITSLPGFLVAFYVLRLGKGRGDPAFPLIAAVLLVMACGNLSMHLFARNWALGAENGPIAVFVLALIYLTVTRLMNLPEWAAFGAMAVLPVLFFGGGLITDATFGPLNGVAPFLPVLVLMLGFASVLRARGNPGSRGIAASAILFSFALIFLGMDQAACPSWSYGTHFLWHLVGAVLLAQVSRVILLTRPAKGTLAPA